MTKKAVSLTLRPDNLLWLKTRVKVKGERSLSEALDQIITEARAGAGAGGAEIRSVVGNARIPTSDKALAEAGAHVAALFLASVGRNEKPGRRGSRKHARPVAPRRKRA
jgi:hypothetical protein